MIGEFLFIGLIGGLLGLFYRNILKGKDMIFAPIYRILSFWVEQKKYGQDWREEAEAEGFNFRLWNLLGWIAYPLGYCIYCSTFWISLFLYILYISSWEDLPSWHWIIIGWVTVIGASHLVVTSACRWLVAGHPDWDTTYEKRDKVQD